jgi:hypothetical protein
MMVEGRSVVIMILLCQQVQNMWGVGLEPIHNSPSLCGGCFHNEQAKTCVWIQTDNLIQNKMDNTEHVLYYFYFNSLHLTQGENPVMKHNFFCWIITNIAANK